MKHLQITNQTIAISRTDSIGDVILTLPVCVWLKKKFPSIKIIFLGSTYTKPVIECLPEVDHVIDWKLIEDLPVQERVTFVKSLKIDIFIHVFPRKEIASLAKKAGIPYRIGTSHRPFHFLTCNIRPNFTRKKSDLHESQLNFELLRPLGIVSIPSLNEISDWMTTFKAPQINLPEAINSFLLINNKTIILHPKSQGSALEWGIKNYISLANLLLEHGFGVIFTGTEKEGLLFRNEIPKHPNFLDSTGKLTLDELIVLIDKSKGLVACSTGPLHISGILGERTCGLFSPRKPIHPGRWKALGKDVHIFTNDKNCPLCAKKKECNCIEEIQPNLILETLITKFD
jgi:ADP-heptose:LPS heptosyltransferase